MVDGCMRVFSLAMFILAVMVLSGCSGGGLFPDIYSEWGYVWGDTMEDSAVAVETDRKGNVYVTGSFSGTIDFDPGPDEVVLTSSETYEKNLFLCKFDPGGNLLWATQWGSDVGNWAGDAYGIAIGPDGISISPEISATTKGSKLTEKWNMYIP